MINTEPFLKPVPSAAQPIKKTVRFAGIPDCSHEEMDPKVLFPTPFAEVYQCRLSQATSELGSATEYVKRLLEQTVLIPSGCHLSSLCIDFLPDIHHKWYFITIEQYQFAQSSLSYSRSQPLSKLSSKPPSRTSCPSSRRSTPPPEIRATPAPIPNLPRRGGSYDTQKPSIPVHVKPFREGKPRTMSHKRLAPEPSLLTVLNQTGHISDKKTWERAKVIEDEIAELIDQKNSRPLAYMTYRAWKDRSSKLATGTVDLLYAQKIAEKARIVRKEAAIQQKFLVNLKHKVIEKLGIVEEKRRPSVHFAVPEAPDKPVKLESIRPATREQSSADRMLNYASHTIDRLQARVESLRLERL